jgi:DNA-binding MarR family transcriptional regulator
MSRARDSSYETTLHVRDHCLCLHAQRAARALARRFDEAFRPLRLTNGQFSLLMGLNRPDPASLGSVAALLAMDRTTLTAALKPLTRRRLVRVAVDEEDGRSRRLTLTAEGRRLLARAVPIWRQMHAELDARLANGAADRLRKELRALTAGVPAPSNFSASAAEDSNSHTRRGHGKSPKSRGSGVGIVLAQVSRHDEPAKRERFDGR